MRTPPPQARHRITHPMTNSVILRLRKEESQISSNYKHDQLNYKEGHWPNEADSHLRAGIHSGLDLGLRLGQNKF